MILTLTYYSSGGGRGPCPGHQRQRPGAPEPATQHQRERGRGYTHFSGQSSCTGCRQRPQRAAHLQHHRRQPGWRFLRQRHSKRRGGEVAPWFARVRRDSWTAIQANVRPSSWSLHLSTDGCGAGEQTPGQRASGRVQADHHCERQPRELAHRSQGNVASTSAAAANIHPFPLQQFELLTQLTTKPLRITTSDRKECISSLPNIIFRVWKSFFFLFM